MKNQNIPRQTPTPFPLHSPTLSRSSAAQIGTRTSLGHLFTFRAPARPYRPELVEAWQFGELSDKMNCEKFHLDRIAVNFVLSGVHTWPFQMAGEVIHKIALHYRACCVLSWLQHI
jgi:hypothetical protein